ncbi:hypothetical protein GUITHDRAFT_62967, partial [Guillardia theta CCMP2712]
MTHSDAFWTIRKDELVFDSPPLVLGKGSYGVVIRASFRGSYVAVKRVLPSRMYNNFIKEMRVISRLRHPCITTVIGAVKDKKEPLLVMELMENGSLYELLRNETVELQGDLILPMLCDVTQGIHFLHAANPPIIHGDIKSHNVLVDSRFRAKIADFGLSTKKSGPCGTPLWMAPELLRGGSNSLASDVYALGILLAEVYSRQDPFLNEDVRQVLRQVADLEREEEKRPEIPADCPSQMAVLMRNCWNKIPESRPSISEIDRRLQAMDSKAADL